MTAGAEPRSGTLATRRIWIVGLLVLALLAVVVGIEPAWNAGLQAWWFDTYQRLRSRTVETTPAMVVEIDDRSVAALGQWPWPRTVLAELIRDIEEYQPLAIGVDILMPEADRLSQQELLKRVRTQDPAVAERLAALRSNDAELAATIGAGPVVLGLAGTQEATGKQNRAAMFVKVVDAAGRGESLSTNSNVGRFEGVLPSIDELDLAAQGHGLMSVSDSAKAVIRKIPLVSDVKGTLTPALAMEMLRVALHASALKVHQSGSAVLGVSIGNFSAPTEDDGSMRIYYSARDPRRHISAIDVLNGNVDPRDLRDKLVLVGVTVLALTDYQNTPLGVAMPGSEIHAQLLENLKDQTWLSRSHWAPAAELAVFVLLGLLLIWATPRWKPRNAALLAIGCVVAMALAGGVEFLSQRQLFDAATPGLALMILFSTLLVLTLAEATRRRRSLERLVLAQREAAAAMAGELRAAQRVQTGILPSADSLSDERRVDLAASMIPAKEVGGDLYDFFRLDANRLFFLVGDVAGKGLSASIFMAISKALYKSSTLRTPQAMVGDLMRAANDEVSRDNPETFFVTVFAAVIDLDTGVLEYCNAGHENPYVLDAGGGALMRLAEAAGPPLCTVDGFAYTAGRHAMRVGDTICIVTDGVVDAQNADGERYGSERLTSLFARPATRDASAREMVDTVLSDVRSFAGAAEPSDDVTMLALRWRGAVPA